MKTLHLVSCIDLLLLSVWGGLLTVGKLINNDTTHVANHAA